MFISGTLSCNNYAEWKRDVTCLFLQLQEISKDVKREVKEAVEFSLQGSELPFAELFTDVYKDQQDLYVRGTDLFTNSLSSQTAQ